MERNDFANSITVRWNNVNCPYEKSHELTELGVQRTDCTEHPLIQRSEQLYIQIFQIFYSLNICSSTCSAGHVEAR
jgi:hypothetical protein